jgi:hypothetical protein
MAWRSLMAALLAGSRSALRVWADRLIEARLGQAEAQVRASLRVRPDWHLQAFGLSPEEILDLRRAGILPARWQRRKP